jgi:pimeloyl-ACP methyl ester carboxylesterase
MTFKRITGPAGLLHVDDGGAAGVAVVFVHSFAGNGAHWSAQLAHLRPKRRAVAFDLRGHGQSQSPAHDYAVESLAGDIAAVVDGLGIKRFVLVGLGLRTEAEVVRVSVRRVVEMEEFWRGYQLDRCRF